MAEKDGRARGGQGARHHRRGVHLRLCLLRQAALCAGCALGASDVPGGGMDYLRQGLVAATAAREEVQA